MKSEDFRSEMKQSRHVLGFNVFAICVLLSLSATISVCGEDAHKTGASKPAPTEPKGRELVGTVVEVTQQFSQGNLDMLAASKSFENFAGVLRGMRMPLRRSATNVTVTVQSRSVTKKTVTDSDGKFKFTGLPSDQCYEISAEMPSRFFGTGEERMARAKVPFEFQGNNWVRLELRNDLVIIKGRIIDSQGQPVSGAKVRGEPCADLTTARAMSFPTRYAISGTDGSYELKDLVPPAILDIAAYLEGRDPISFSQDPFYVAIYAKADGYIQDYEKCKQFWRDYRASIAHDCESCWLWAQCKGPCPWEISQSDGSFRRPQRNCDLMKRYAESSAYFYVRKQTMAGEKSSKKASRWPNAEKCDEYGCLEQGNKLERNHRDGTE